MMNAAFRRRLKNALVAIMIVVMLAPTPSYAFCETAGTAIAQLQTMITKIRTFIREDMLQKINFIREKFFTATYEMMTRLDEYDMNFRQGYSTMVRDYVEALKKQTNQESNAQLDQTGQMGMMIDAQEQEDARRRKQSLRSQAQRMYEPSELSCQLDSAGPGLARARQIAKALNSGLSNDDALRRANAKGSISETGRAQETKALFDEYLAMWCDPAMGDPGCMAPGMMPGLNKDIPLLLWGEKQTIDAGNPAGQALIRAALRTLVSPESPDPITPGAMGSADGQMALMERHAASGRAAAITNALGQMLTERVGGSGIDMTQPRAGIGVPAENASTNASASEVLGWLNKDRFNSTYIVHLVGSPEVVMREQNTINAIRAQTQARIYAGLESRLFLQAADTAIDLDRDMPGTAIEHVPLKD